MQAEAGYMSLTGEPDGPPARYGLSIVDLMTGLAAAFGLLAGVLKPRARPAAGRTSTPRSSTSRCTTSTTRHWYLNAGAVTGAHARARRIPSLTPSQLYRTRDGWIFIMCNKEKFWGVLAAGARRAASGSTIPTSRTSRRASRTASASPSCSTRRSRRAPPTSGSSAFAGEVPAAPVYDVTQALENPFVAERGSVLDFKPIRRPAAPA